MITLDGSSPVPSAPVPESPRHGVGFIGFTTTSVGFIIANMQNSSPGQLWRTTDGGQTWAAVTF